MKALIEAFARNRVAANLLMVLIIAAGLVVAPTLEQEVTPQVKLALVSISVVYPGAAVDEVENAVTIPIEEAVRSLSGVERISSASREGHSMIGVEFASGVAVSERVDELRARVNAIEAMPPESEDPLVEEWRANEAALYVALRGGSEPLLRRVADQVRDDLASLLGVANVTLVGLASREIAIELSSGALARHGLTARDVADAVSRSSLHVPSGSLRSEQLDVLLRVDAQGERARDFERIALVSGADGTRLRVSDVADVRERRADIAESVRLDGEPAVLVRVARAENEHVVEVSEKVRAFVEEVRAELPEGMAISVWRDEAVTLEKRQQLLASSAIQGFVLVVIALALFLRLHVALWVAASVPVIFLGTAALMALFDISINMVTLMAFIVALGLVVDDSIIVGERFDALADDEAGSAEGATRSAIRAASELSVPLVAAVGTTMVFFLPILFLGGIVGDLAAPLATVVIACLAVATVECFLILPTHLMGGHGGRRWPSVRVLEALRARTKAGLDWVVDHWLLPSVRRILVWRYVVLGGAVFVSASLIGACAGGYVPGTFFPDAEGSNVLATVKMPAGTNLRATGESVALLEREALSLQRELAAQYDRAPIQRVVSFVGVQPSSERGGENRPLQARSVVDPQIGEVHLELASDLDGLPGAREIETLWSERVARVGAPGTLRFSSELFPSPDPIAVEFSGGTPEALRDVAADLRRRLDRLAVVEGVEDSLGNGKLELRIGLRPDAEPLGMNVADLANQVRQGFYGEEVQRIQRGREEIPVFVRYPASERTSIQDLERMFVRVPEGDPVPFAIVATVTEQRGFQEIRRRDGERVVLVTGRVDGSRARPAEVVEHLDAQVIPALLEDHPGIAYSLEGESREREKFMTSLGIGAVLALAAIYSILAISLQSYSQPLVVMAAIPMGAAGAVFGHLVLGVPFTAFGIIGIMSLSGIVVNDSLVLTHAANAARRSGASLSDALQVALRTRFRPIVLTTVTTTLGLTPLLLQTGMEAYWLKPAAVSLAVGVLVATVGTLFVVPVALCVLNDFAKRSEEEDAVEWGTAQIRAVP